MKPRRQLMLLVLIATLPIRPIIGDETGAIVAKRKYASGQLLSIEGKLNGRPVRCVIDTGASHHAIDTKFKPLLGTCRPYEPNGSIEICSAQQLQVGGFNDRMEAESAVLDLSSLRKASGLNFDVIVGMPFLLDRVIQINPVVQQFQLSTALSTARGETFDLTFDDLGRPRTTIVVQGQSVNALLDTGSTADITLEKELFQTVLQNQTTQPKKRLNQVEALTIAGSEARQTLKGVEVRIGSQVTSECTIFEAESNKIGLGFLSRFDVTIDFPKQQLILATPHESHRTAKSYEIDTH